MTGFNVVDVIVVLLVVAAAIAGYRQGFITAMFNLVTTIAGALGLQTAGWMSGTGGSGGFFMARALFS